MAILVTNDTRLCVSGITGREGTFHTLNNRNYGTNVVSGVTPGKGGRDVEGIPVFNTFHDAVAETGVQYVLDFGTQEIHGAANVFPGLTDLDESAALELVDEQGDARLFRVIGC